MIDGFPCPECSSMKNSVVNTRFHSGDDAGRYRRRRRECVHCGARFSTIEIADDNYGELQRARRWVLRVKKLMGET